MDDGSAFILIILLLLSAFFSGSETAFFSLSRIYLKKLENKNTAQSRRILSLLGKPRQLLVTILFGNTFVNMGISSLATLIAIGIADRNNWNLSSVVTLQVIITTSVVLIFGEILPKLIAMATAISFANLASLPLQVISYILHPLVWLVDRFSLLLSKKQLEDKHLGKHFTTEEFHNLIQSESSRNSLEEHEKKILVGLFRFREAELTEIYTPRVKITAIEEKQSLEELRDLILATGYSRIPVYRETIDDIIGIVYVKDLLMYPEKNSITEFMRPAWFVTENMKVQSLLNQFKIKKMQLAVVVDEYGGTSGIISLEDILEEIVGEIHDEHDHEEMPELVRQEDGSYILSGSVNIRQLNEEFSIDIDPEEYDNLAEYLLSQFNHVPATGEVHRMDELLEFRILESDGKSIKQVQVIKLANEL
ncbi:MAG TPA: hemolysin family protein [Candidatus Cloacimonadota bacterium]|nr:hemolysin family protein [Candidatus Cloacimonadota bacterium]HQH49963.1 hemolysin family protein [Candidatus Cloacimonadota bacterium]